MEGRVSPRFVGFRPVVLPRKDSRLFILELVWGKNIWDLVYEFLVRDDCLVPPPPMKKKGL